MAVFGQGKVDEQELDGIQGKNEIEFGIAYVYEVMEQEGAEPEQLIKQIEDQDGAWQSKDQRTRGWQRGIEQDKGSNKKQQEKNCG